MRSMMRRTTLREIKQSLGRYLAILAIIALGVGFFAGLKETKPVMLQSADAYLTEKQFYDYRLLSTLGFEEEDVEVLAAKEGVRAVEGAISADILFQNSQGNESVIKAHSLTENINGLHLLAGRMPEQADECVVDSLLYNESAIGSTVLLSENNTEEDLDNFTYKEYTITGIVESSYYIQFERGNTSLGNGMISGYMYLPLEGFQMDYYTEIFVKFDEDYPLYSEEYDAYLDEKEVLWEEYCEAQGERRYQAIVTEADEELADAEREFEEQKADAEAELADAKKELEDAKAEIADGEESIAEAEAELRDAEAEIRDAEKTIKENEADLIESENTIAENEALLAEKRQEYEDGLAAYQSGKSQVEGTINTLNNAMAEIQKSESELSQSKLEEQRTALEGLINQYPDNPDNEKYLEDLAYIEYLLNNLPALQAELSEKKTQVQNGLSQARAADAQLNSVYMQLAEGAEELANGEAELEEARVLLADGKEQLEEARAELADAKAEVRDGWQTLEEKKQELEDAKEEVADGFKEYEEAYEEYLTEIADAEAELADARQEIADIESPDTYVLGRNTNIGYVCLESDADIVNGIANVFPIFFFLVAALVCITTMNRMVEEQRTQIGVLKALGYGEGAIMGKYLFYSGSAAFIGSVGGFFLGTWLFPTVIWIAYRMMYRMGEIQYLFDWKMFLISLVAALACSMGATWISIRYELKETAAVMMRPKSPKAGKRVFLERVTFIWKRLSFLQKVSVRNIVRYKKRFFMMIIGISGCTALLVTGFGVRDSVTNIAEQQFEEIHLYDLSIMLNEGVGNGDMTGIRAEKTEALRQMLREDFNGDSQLSMETTMDLVVKDQIKSVNIIVAQDPQQIGTFIDLHTSAGSPLTYPAPGEAVITDKISDTYKLEVGDTVKLRDENMKEITLTVSGICENYIYNYVYLHPDTYESSIGELTFKNMYVMLPEEVDAHEAAAAVMQEDNITSVSVTEDMLVRISSMMNSMNYIVILVIANAASLAFIVLYNLSNINITERIREIATIKVLGFFKKETASYVFRENMVLTAIGCALGLFLGKMLHLYVMHEINIDMISFDVHVSMVGYLISIFLTFIFTWGVNLIMSGKLEKINMAESLKSVD